MKSRQLAYQYRKRGSNQCVTCGAKPVVAWSRCLKHAVAERERQRLRRGSIERHDSKTYRLEQGRLA